VEGHRPRVPRIAPGRRAVASGQGRGHLRIETAGGPRCPGELAPPAGFGLGRGKNPPPEPVEDDAAPVDQTLPGLPPDRGRGGFVGIGSGGGEVGRRLILGLRPEAAGVGEDDAVAADHPQARVGPLLHACQEGLGAAGVQRTLLGERRGEDAPLLHHGPLLRHQKLRLVNIQIEEAGGRQEDQQQVERQEAGGEPREVVALHPPSSLHR
jgi:hypothetical protein